MTGGVGRRRDQQLIHPAILAELRERAQDGVDMRAALQTLNAKRYAEMEHIRMEATIGTGAALLRAERARGWLEFESDLGDALLTLVEGRGST